MFFSWNFGDGNTSVVQNPTHIFSNSGTYIVSLYVNDGCSYDTTSVTITVFPSPVVNFSVTPDSICVNYPFTFTNLSSGLAGCNWNFGDGNTSTNNNPTHAYGSAGVYTVTLTGTAQTTGCIVSKVRTVTVESNPTASYTYTPTNGCVQLLVNFTNTSNNSSFQTWDFGDGNTSGLVNPSHTYQNAGTYSIQLVIENASGCKDSITHIVTVHPLPVADFTITPSNACISPILVARTNNSSGAVSYSWNFGNNFTSTANNPTSMYNNPGTYPIQLTATSMYGCSDSKTVTFTVYPTLTISYALIPDTACQGQSLLFQSNNSFADSIIWNFGNGDQLTGNNVTYSYPNPGTYPLEAIA